MGEDTVSRDGGTGVVDVHMLPAVKVPTVSLTRITKKGERQEAES